MNLFKCQVGPALFAQRPKVDREKTTKTTNKSFMADKICAQCVYN